MKECPNKCDAKIYHNEGISKKTGEPYENYKCGKCGAVEWVDLKAKKAPAGGYYKPQGTNFQGVETKEVMIMDEIEKIKIEIQKLRKYLQGKLGE